VRKRVATIPTRVGSPCIDAGGEGTEGSEHASFTHGVLCMALGRCCEQRQRHFDVAWRERDSSGGQIKRLQEHLAAARHGRRPLVASSMHRCQELHPTTAQGSHQKARAGGHQLQLAIAYRALLKELDERVPVLPQTLPRLLFRASITIMAVGRFKAPFMHIPFSRSSVPVSLNPKSRYSEP